MAHAALSFDDLLLDIGKSLPRQLLYGKLSNAIYTLRSLAARMSRRAVRRDCQHAGTPHQHGNRDSYALDGCRCPDCRRANALTERQRRRETAYGRWQPFTDAEPARQHLRELAKRGIGLRRAAQLAGVPYTTLTALVYGAPGAGSPPSRRVRHDTSGRILSVPLEASPLAAGARTEATGTRRRLQALVAHGWTITTLADLLGRDVASLRHTLRRDRINTSTAIAVGELYDRLWNRPPDESSPACRQAAEHARARARRSGWSPAMAWDDMDTDPEPHPRPPGPRGGGNDQLDDLDIEILTDRIIAGEETPLTPTERDEVIQRLTRSGHSLSKIAEMLDITTRTVSRRRRAARAA